MRWNVHPPTVARGGRGRCGPAVMRLRRGLSAVAGAGLLLAACGGGGELPEDPQEAVAQAAENAFEGGFTLTLDADISEDVIAQVREDDRQAAVALSFLREDPVSITVTDGGRVGITVRSDGETFAELRVLEDALYARADLERAAEAFGQDPSGVRQMREQVGQMGGAEGPFGPVAGLLQALLEGRWAGIIDLPEDPSKVLAPLGGFQVDREEARAALRQAGLSDPRTFVESYVTVTNREEGTFQVSLDLRGLVEAFADIRERVDGGPGSVQLPQDAPETLEGITLRTDGDRLSAVEGDVFRLVQAMDDTEGLEELSEAGISEGDVVLRLRIDPPGGVDAPGDAETLTWSQVENLMRMFMGGFAPGA